MDTLRAFILILHAKTARDGFPEQFAINRKDLLMTPKMQGVAAALGQLKHSLESQAQDLLSRADTLNARGAKAIGEAKANLDATEQAIVEVEQLNASLAGSNGGPTSDGSATQSAAPSTTAAEPAASWSGTKPA